MKGSWASTPISLILDRDFYVSEDGREADQIKGAIETWNAWHRIKYGTNIFTIVNDGTGQDAGRDIPPLTTTCDQVAYTSANTDSVGIWKIRPYGDGINRRVACQSGTGTRLKLMDDLVQGSTDWSITNHHISGASVLLNFDGWNVAGRDELDIESLAVHELGHVLGLLHSCNGTSGNFLDGTGAVNCSSAPAKYEDAVMFPSLVSGQIRRILQPNDYARINCLY